MRTQALRVTVGAYSSGGWHVAIIEDNYERGVLVNSELTQLSHPRDRQTVRTEVLRCLDVLMAREDDRMRLEAAAGTQAVPAAASA